MRLISLASAGRTFIIRFDYDRALIEEVKGLPERKFSKDDGDAQWRVPARHWSYVQTFAADFNFDLDEAAAEFFAEQERKGAETEADADIPVEFFNGKPIVAGKRTLFKHQVSGVLHLAKNKRAILADDMGLGKTTQALVAAKMFSLPVVVVAPASLRANWFREARELECPITEVYTWAKFPSSFATYDGFHNGYVVIFDEAHYAQAGSKSQRGARFLDVCSEATAAFLLTGTPLKNGKPINIMPLLEAIRHPIVADKKKFQIRYCDAHATAWTRWDVNGAKNLDELHKLTKDKILRRLKSECLDLPQFMRFMREAEVSEKSQQQYEKKFRELRLEYEDRLSKGKIQSGAEALVMLTHLRQASSVAKVETTVELAQELIEQGQSVVIFTSFVESLNQMKKVLGDEMQIMTGETPPSTRQALIDTFQGGGFKVFATTFGTGGVGVNLQRASTVILHDRPWTPADADQAESRLHRYGQKQAVTSIWLQYGAVDKEIDDMLEDKEERIQLVLAGERKTMRGTMTMNDIAMKVLPKLFDNEGSM